MLVPAQFVAEVDRKFTNVTWQLILCIDDYNHVWWWRWCWLCECEWWPECMRDNRERGGYDGALGRRCPFEVQPTVRQDERGAICVQQQPRIPNLWYTIWRYCTSWFTYFAACCCYCCSTNRCSSYYNVLNILLLYSAIPNSSTSPVQGGLFCIAMSSRVKICTVARDLS